MLPVGIAKIDITPPSGLAMAGFGSRTQLATGAHDALTVRAIAVGDTALVAVDAIGIEAASCNRIIGACGLPEDRVIIAATHTHAGPHTMAGRLGGHVDPAYLEQLEAAAASAINIALRNQKPCDLTAGMGRLDGIARNRRNQNGVVDPSVPILKVTAQDGKTIAVLVSFACHPVVLDASNREWTADYPHTVRQTLEAEYPDTLAIFATGCAGDVNTGHSAHQSNSLSRGATRTFAEAHRIGRAVANAAIGAKIHLNQTAQIDAAAARCALTFSTTRSDDLDALSRTWRDARASVDPAAAAILDIWLDWANGPARQIPHPFPTKVGALRWGDFVVAHMPGEIFAMTGLEVRAALPEALFVLCYCGDNPGYLPPMAEFPSGGYEVAEAHRFYGMPGAFAPGNAELIRDKAIECGQRLRDIKR